MVYGEWYDLMITSRLTVPWYTCVFSQFKEKTKVLDIGVGTGSALASQFSLLEKKDITVDAIDYDAAYVDYAKKKNSHKNVNFYHCSVYDDLSDLSSSKNLSTTNTNITTSNENSGTDVNSTTVNTGVQVAKYDYIYFSGSISLLPDPAKALKHVKQYLAPNGHIFITQTFQHKENFPLLNAGLSYIKPYMYYFVGVDFGKLSYLSDLWDWVGNSGLYEVELKKIEGSVDNKFQSAYCCKLSAEGS